MSYSLGTRRAVSIAIVCGLLAPLPPTEALSAPVNKALRHVAGTVGYQAAPTSSFTPVSGEQALNDDAIAVTQASSKALVSLEDSSMVALGQNTRVRLGAFNNIVAGPGSTIALLGGAMRFEIRHPQGAKANYTFTTATASIAVRGTIGLVEASPAGDTIVCVSCEPGDVVVTVNGITSALVTGQVLSVSSALATTTGPMTAERAQHFQEQGLGTGPATDDLFSTAFTRVKPAINPAEAAFGAVVTGLIVNAATKPAISSPPNGAPGIPGNLGLTGHQIHILPAPSPSPTPGGHP